MYINKTIINVFIGCCFSSFLMEILMASAPHSANLITCLQFAFISMHGFIFTSNFGRVRPQIPLKEYSILIILFFVTCVANNFVYALHVSSTLHMIIRCASSPASMLVSCYVKKKTPKLNNAIGSILITVGVVLAMYEGATIAERNTTSFIQWCIGVVLLLFTLLTGAFTGLQQEILFAKYGKHPKEMLFYTHALPMPLFFTIYPQLQETAFSLPLTIWALIFFNILSQFLCTESVHQLATRQSSVTVTFILTVRKFVSLIISSIFFKNNLTYFHFVGSIFVIVGTIVYFDCFVKTRQRSVSLKDR